jgi:hypothetical protein
VLVAIGSLYLQIMAGTILTAADSPQERPIACRDRHQVRLRTHTREDLLFATECKLEKIRLQELAADGSNDTTTSLNASLYGQASPMVG